MNTKFKLTLTLPSRNGSMNQALKFTGQSSGVEAQLGELSTLDQIGGAIIFLTQDNQFTNASSFALPILSQTGLRINLSSTFGNMFVNRFAVVKRMELAGGFVTASQDVTNVFSGSPEATGEIYNGGLCVASRQNVVLTPEDTFMKSPDFNTLNQQAQISKFVWSGEFLFNAFTNLCFRFKNTAYDPTINSHLVMYFDEVKPMVEYPKYLASLQRWNEVCKMETPETEICE